MLLARLLTTNTVAAPVIIACFSVYLALPLLALAARRIKISRNVRTWLDAMSGLAFPDMQKAVGNFRSWGRAADVVF